ncbi:vanillin dehydrogenase [Microdochium nivale]|nr:vanillin dehydrogenase [Microdochium nivale]
MYFGNTAVLKGSELSSKCYWAVADVLRETGLPAGCLNLVFHKQEDAAEVTNALICHPAVKKITFTDSTQVGSIIAMEAAKHVMPVLMELSGKTNAVTMADADLDVAATQ